MPKRFTLDYWIDGGWYVGRLQEIPTVFSQGETLAELEKIFRMPTDSCSKSRLFSTAAVLREAITAKMEALTAQCAG